MRPITAFANLNSVPVDCEIPVSQFNGPAKKPNHSEWIDAAENMAGHMLNFTFEQQNEMLLVIQEKLIKNRMERIKELESMMEGLALEFERTNSALRSING